MKLKEKIFTFSLIIYSFALLSFPIPSNWFEEFQLSNKSKIYRQIQFSQIQDKKKFIFYELSFNETRKWEELRIQGEVEINLETLILKVETCALYGKKDMQKRWALLKSFDCKHLEWAGTLRNNELILTEKNDAFEQFQLELAYQGKHAIFKTIKRDSEELIGWGIDAKKVYRAKFGKDLSNSKQIPILSVRDSIIYFKPQPNFIQYIEVTQPKAESFLESSN